MKAAVSTFIAFAALMGGCSTSPPLDPYVVRLEVGTGFLDPASGTVHAREDAREAASEGTSLDLIEGNRAALRRDLGLDLAFLLSGSIELRPTSWVELRGYASRIEFEGTELLERQRNFDGVAFGPSERVVARLSWMRYDMGAAFRILDLPGTELLLHAGVERSTFDATLEANPPPRREVRQARTGAPFAGLEARWSLAPRTLAYVRLLGGYWNHEGNRLALAEVAVGLRFHVAGPLDLGATYHVSFRDAKAHVGGELSAIRIIAHGPTLDVGLRF